MDQFDADDVLTHYMEYCRWEQMPVALRNRFLKKIIPHKLSEINRALEKTIDTWEDEGGKLYERPTVMMILAKLPNRHRSRIPDEKPPPVIPKDRAILHRVLFARCEHISKTPIWMASSESDWINWENAAIPEEDLKTAILARLKDIGRSHCRPRANFGQFIGMFVKGEFRPELDEVAKEKWDDDNGLESPAF